MARRPQLAQLIHAAMESRLSDVHTALPGIVERYDEAKRCADVRLAVTYAFTNSDGESDSMEHPVIPEVPITFPAGGGCSIVFPISVGDPVVVIAFESNATITQNATDQANGMRFLADGRTELIFNNTSAAARTVTITDTPDEHGRLAPTAKKSISLPTTGLRIVAPLPGNGWNQPSGTDAGFVQVDIDNATGVTVGCVRTNRQ